MKLSFSWIDIKSLSLAASLTLLSACAGDTADLEEADHLIGSGGIDNANRALSLVEPKLASATGSTAFEVNRLYAGAKMQAAGFDGRRIISVLVYKTSDDAVANVRSAVSLNGNSQTFLSDVVTQLNKFVASPTYTASTDARAKAGIQYQLGLANFFEALRSSFTNSGLDQTTGALSSAQCQANFKGQVSIVKDLSNDLTSSHDSLIASNLDTENPLVKLVKNFQDNVPNKDLSALTVADIVTICDYLALQSAK